MGSNNEKITIHPDEDIADLIPGYLEHRQNDITEIQKALSDQNYDPIRILAHSMKGSGGGYGFDTITDIGRKMEIAAQESDAALINTCLEELIDYLDRLEII